VLILIRIRMLRILSNTDVESDREKWGKTNSDISTLVPHYNRIRIRISILGADTDVKNSDNYFHVPTLTDDASNGNGPPWLTLDRITGDSGPAPAPMRADQCISACACMSQHRARARAPVTRDPARAACSEVVSLVWDGGGRTGRPRPWILVPSSLNISAV